MQRSNTLNVAKARESIDIQFTRLTYEIRESGRGPRKQILKDMNGFFKSGELTAVMGPSGAGKSTLLNILSGFYQGRLTGKIEYIGDAGKQNWDKYKKASCYIQQMDCLHDMFTIDESMRIASYLKISQKTREKTRYMLIDDILNTLNLLKVRSTRVSQLSGGQRKRLSIALELLGSPPIMFLDEPTTGLDSSSSLQCVSMLQTLSRSNRTVICTIHQPSATIYEMFDYVYLMADGCCMYAGTPDNTVNYFAQQGFQCPKHHNPADYMIEVIGKEYGNYNDQLVLTARQYCVRDEVTLTPRVKTKKDMSTNQKALITPPPETTKFRVLLHRCITLLYRDWTLVHMKVLVHFFLALLLGLLYEHAGDDGNKTLSNVGYMFVNVIYLIYTSMMPAVMQFPSELAILKKERFNNWYQLKTYYIAMSVCSIPIQAFISFIYSSVSYWLSSQPLEWSRYGMFLLISTLTVLISEGVGTGLGTLLNPINGTFVGAISTCVMLCMSGFLVFFNHMPPILHYISYLSYTRYAFDGFLQAIYGNQREKLACPNNDYCHFRIPSVILQELYLSEPMFWVDVAVLLAFCVVVRIMVYVLLKIRLSKMC